MALIWICVGGLIVWIIWMVCDAFEKKQKLIAELEEQLLRYQSPLYATRKRKEEEEANDTSTLEGEDG